VGKGYAEGPAAEEAERRLEELERGDGRVAVADARAAVFGATESDPNPHFLGWADEVDADELFDSGTAWGITVRRVAAPPDVSVSDES
jgi:hypothetical protein